MIDTEGEREAETQAEGETGSIWGARRGARSPFSRIMPWAEGSTNPLIHPGCPSHNVFKLQINLVKVLS